MSDSAKIPTPTPTPTSTKVVASKVTASTALDLVKGEISDYITSLGKDAEDSASQIKTFLATIEPDVTQAMADGDVEALEYLRDRMTLQLGRVSFRLLYQERAKIATITTAVLKTALKIGIAAIAA